MNKIIPLVLILAVGACTTTETAKLETPQQRLYALHGTYAIVGGMAATYIELPEAKPNIKAKIKTYDARIYTLLQAARQSLDAGNTAAAESNMKEAETALGLMREIVEVEK